MEVLLLAVMGICNIVCFALGARIGQKTAKGEDITLPAVRSPTAVIREHRAKKKAEEEETRIDVILRNIESYDGTGQGQEEVPR